MKVATSFALNQDADGGAAGAYARLVANLGAPPQLLLLHASVRADAVAMLASLKAVAPGVSIHGGTSCIGVMTQDGFHRSDAGAVGMLGVLDPEGAYGVG